MTDMINPSHYRGDRKFEPIEVIEDWGLNYRLGNAVKYISRNGRKPGEDRIEGLRKSIWYLEREIAALSSDNQPPKVTYEDVLEDFSARSAEGEDPIFEYGNWGAAQPVAFGQGEDVLSFSDNLFSSSDYFVSSDVDDQSLDHWGESSPADDIEKKFDDALSKTIADFGDYEPYDTGNSVNLRKKAEDFSVPFTWDSDEDFMFQTAHVYEGDEEDSRKFWEELDIAAVENVWVKLSDEEILETLAHKDLDQFSDDQIVSTVFKRGLIIGVRKNGTTCLLGENGRCKPND